ncbi:MAG: TIGR02147 family protein [Bdellovibrionales bacterium]
MKSIYEFEDYKEYLEMQMNMRSKESKGVRSRFAAALGCRPGYVSQILTGSAHLSLEQAEQANEFLGHSDQEGELFLLLVLHARAGSSRLRNRLVRQIQRTKDLHVTLRPSDSPEPLTEDEKATVFSCWIHLALLILVHLPNYLTRDAVKAHLNVSEAVLKSAIEALLRLGLLRERDGRLSSDVRYSFLDRSSPLGINMLKEWRLKAIEAVTRDWPGIGFETSIINFARSDRERILMKIRQCLHDVDEIVRASKSEEMYCLNVDFFEVGKGSFSKRPL